MKRMNYCIRMFLRILVYNITVGFIYTKNIKKSQITVYYNDIAYTYKGDKGETFKITNLEDLKNNIQNAANEYKSDAGYVLPVSNDIKKRNFKILSVKKKFEEKDIDINNVNDKDDINVVIDEVRNVRRGAIILDIDGRQIGSDEILNFYGADLYDYLRKGRNDDLENRADNGTKEKWLKGFLKLIGSLYDIEGNIEKCSIKDVIVDNLHLVSPGMDSTFIEAFVIWTFCDSLINDLLKGRPTTIVLDGAKGINIKSKKIANDPIDNTIKPTSKDTSKPTGKDNTSKPTGKNNNNSTTNKSGCCC